MLSSIIERKSSTGMPHRYASATTQCQSATKCQVVTKCLFQSLTGDLVTIF